MAEPRMPAGLAAAGKAFWRKLVAEFEPSTADTERIAMLCRIKDRIAEAESIIAAEGLMPGGKRHDLLPQLRADQRLADQLLARLGLEDEHGEKPMDGLTSRAVAANRRRWGGPKGQQSRDELAVRRRHRAVGE